MADSGIIFSAPMVRALLDGRKTQTRRLLSKTNLYFNGTSWPNGLNLTDMRLCSAWVDGGSSPAGNPGPYLKAYWPYGRLRLSDESSKAEWLMARLYPKWQAGDRLYVREAWSHTGIGVWSIADARISAFSNGHPIYRATDLVDPGTKFWPSIHMPREFSRLTLIVEGVKVERLQDISEADARAEGPVMGKVTGHAFNRVADLRLGGPEWRNARDWFADLWDSLHTKAGERWDENPWIVALTFRVVHGNFDRLQSAAFKAGATADA